MNRLGIKISIVSLFLGLILGTLGCTTDPMPGMTPDPGDDGPADIGPDGGVITGPSGAGLDIPAGALSSPVKIRITSDSTGAPSIDPSQTACGGVYALLPHGTIFNTPITLRVPFDPTLIPPGATPKLFKAELGGSYAEIAATVEGNTLVAQISSFS